MGETGIVRFPGNLDPKAQEFRPRNNPIIINQTQIQIPFFRPPPQLYYPYTPPPPPPPPYTPNDVQVVPFCDGGGGSVGYPTHSPASYVCVTSHPPLPPPSSVPTRALVLSLVSSDVSETVIRRELEVFGEVRGVQMERVFDGIVTVHFYDLRHAEMALKEIREQHMQQQTRLRNHYSALMMLNTNNDNSSSNSGGEISSNLNSCYLPLPPPAHGLIAGRAVWAQFIVPASNAVPDGNNQGTIVVFNLDSGVSSSSLKEVFQAFGPVKELRETPLKRHQRFIEFYDIRDAARALKEMNGKEIYGKPVVIEFSRPGGYSKKFFNANNIINTNPTTLTTTTTTASSHKTRNSSDYIPPPCKFSTRSPRCFFSQTQPSRKKSPSRNPSVSGDNSSIEGAMAAISLAGNAVEDEIVLVGGSPRKNTKKIHINQSTMGGGSNKQQHQQVNKNRTKPWKGRQVKKFDSRFLINEEAMAESNCKDSRTTVMIKNIPNKYSQKLLLNMLDNHCINCNAQIGNGDEDQPLSSYDFVYLPIDFNNKCNVGYGFVNMTSPEATLRLYKAFHLQNWEVFNSRKICEVTYARVQGLEALKEHFKNSKFPCEMDHYLPVVFSPPRDGRQLTEPLPVVGNGQCSNSISSKQQINNADPNVSWDDQDHDNNDGLDGSDTLENDLLIGGSISSSGGGDMREDDDDRDSGSSHNTVLVA